MGDRRLLKINPLNINSIRFCSRLCLFGFALANFNVLQTAPSQAAETIVAHYGLFESSLPVNDLQNYAQTRQTSPALAFFLRFMSKEQQQSLRELLQTQFEVSPAALDTVLNEPSGAKFLQQASAAIINSHNAGIAALRSAAILGIKPEGLSVLSFLKAYPNPRLVLDLPKALKFVDNIYPDSLGDRLATTSSWQMLVDYQIAIAQNQSYSACLFGDSISSALGNRLGSSIYNFAMGGLSSVSLVEQLQRLTLKNVQCQNAVIAIGANDALYATTDVQFTQNLTTAIALSRQMGAKQVVLLPAFYSTLAASKNPKLAGTISRVERINQLIRQVAKAEGVVLKNTELEPLFNGKTLKEDLTYDGVHLNAAGLKVYRPIILNILSLLP
jgi:lysophospholipase L1-like esterase